MVEIITITDFAKKAIAELCNEVVVTEYDMILNYPRIIEHIVNFEKIKDDQLVNDIDKLGKDSLGHYAIMDRMIRGLGVEMVWLTSTLPRLVAVDYVLEQQLEKEKAACGLYTEARKIAMANKATVKTGGIFNLFRTKYISEEDVVSFGQTIHDLDRLILDETRHIRVVEDSLATHKALMSK
ncbi:hypothetical protein ACFLX8_04550 [Chloroflexota bacterium]